MIFHATITMTCIGDEPPKFQVLRNSIVNDEIEDALCPFGIVKCKNGDWVTNFQDKGDTTAGSKVYFVRSSDQGKTWSKPFKTVVNESDAVGLTIQLFTLPNGKNLAIFMAIQHQDKGPTGFKGYRTSAITIYSCSDDLQTFTEIQKLASPPQSLLSVTGNCIIELKNGDLIIPGYVYPKGPAVKDAVYGSGFFRSKDGGKTWGPFELAFKEPDTNNKKNFNESTFAVKADGTIVGFTRVDSTKTKNMWKVISADNGITWSIPEETNIPAVYPMITRLENGKYVMICGLLSIKPARTVAFLVSDDGENYTLAGRAYYSRPEHNNGISYNTATGGSQAFLKVDKNKLFVTFYACDPKLPGRHHTYVDGNLVEIN